MARLFFLLSGEHPTLPFAEFNAILEAEKHPHKTLERLGQIIRIEAAAKITKLIASRAALTRACSREILCCEATAADILENVRSAPIEDFIQEGESFAVRVRRVGQSARQLVSMELEGKLGAELSRTKAKVNLTRPDKTFLGVITRNRFVFGVKLVDILAKPFTERRPRRRPFFHPSAMQPKLARCMVNLARAKEDDLVLDPFCGTASILIEAGSIGCRVVGFDVKRRMVMGSLFNLTHHGLEPEGLVVADSNNPPITRADCIVTDPPYGRLSTTLGRDTAKVFRDFLSMIEYCIPKGGHVCLAAPRSIGLGKVGQTLGFRLVESHFVYVHRSLTREIAVLERV